MAAWFLLPAAATAVSAIGKHAAHQANEPIKQKAFRQKAQTGYLRKYMSDLQGRSASRARTELAMRPALRAIGAQQAKGQRQLEYQAAQQGLQGSGIEAQKQLALQAGTTQAVAGLGEKIALSAQAKAQQLQAAREGQRMKIMGQIGQKEAAVSEANRAAQFQASERFRQQTLAHNQQSKAIAIQGAASVGAQALSGWGQHEMGKIAATQAADLTTEQMNFQLQLAGLQQAEGGVAGVPKKGYQGGGTPLNPDPITTNQKEEPDELVEFLSGTQGYQQALQTFQQQRDVQTKQMEDDYTEQQRLYTEQAPLRETLTGLEAIPKTDVKRSQKSKIKKIKSQLVEQPEEKTFTYGAELTPEDSSRVAKDHLLDLARKGIVTPEGFAKSFKSFRENKIENIMTDYYYQASEGDVNSDEVFTTLRDPIFMKGKNFKAYRTSLIKVLNDQQKEKEQIAGATEKTADKMSSAKMNVVGNLHDMKGFFGEKDAEGKWQEGVAFDSAMKRLKDVINYEGGIPYFEVLDKETGAYAQLDERQSYDKIVEEVRKIVDELTIPISQLQIDSKQGLMDYLGVDDESQVQQIGGTWQVVGGDEKWKRTIVNELTKDLNKPYMWKETVHLDDDKGDEEYTSPDGQTFKVKKKT